MIRYDDDDHDHDHDDYTNDALFIKKQDKRKAIEKKICRYCKNQRRDKFNEEISIIAVVLIVPTLIFYKFSDIMCIR